MPDLLGLTALLHALSQGLGQVSLPEMAFFTEISRFLDDELIHEYLPHLGKRVIGLIGGLALVLMTLWIMVQGFRILTGRSREPMMALVVDALRATLIIGVALGASAAWGPLYETLTNGTARVVSDLMTDDADGQGPYQDIDRALAIMQVALQTIDTVDSNGNLIVDKRKDWALGFAGFGLGVPAIVAAAALLLNKIGIGLLLALGPLFILSLLFKRTQPMFQTWLYYLMGTWCSMALLSVMVTLALDTVIAVGMAFWVSDAAGFGGEGLTSLTMQQGGLGVLMTGLIIATPPMAAMLFRGTLSHFSAYSAFGSLAAAWSGTRYPTYPTHAPPQGQETPVPTQAHRVSTPAQTQADEVKQAADTRSFTERYPNATASLDGHRGDGDPLPLDLHPIARAALPPPVDAALVGLHNGNERQAVLQDQAFIDALLDSSERNPADVLSAQRIAREAGYSLMTRSFERNPLYTDGVTGNWGPETESALRTYLNESPERILRRKNAFEQLTSHLDIPTNPRSSNTSTYIEQDGRRYDFIFSADSYANALDYGYTARDAVMNVDVDTYLAAVDAAARISDAGTDAGFSVSSGWRPNIGSGAHPNGVGLDFTRMQMVQGGREVGVTFIDPGKRVGHDPSVPEPPLAQQYRESLYAIREQAGIRQIFTPWQMLHSPQGQFRANRPNRPNDNDWIHRHHLHIGLKVY